MDTFNVFLTEEEISERYETAPVGICLLCNTTLELLGVTK